MAKRKSIMWSIISKLFGIIFLLLILLILNILTFSIDNYVFNQIVLFLNHNVGLIIIISVVFLIGDLFDELFFPLNLPAPLFSAAGAVLLVNLTFRVFQLVESMLDENMFQVFRDFSGLIYAAVFLIVLIVGYIAIFAGALGAEEEYEKVKPKKIEKKPRPTWEDVGDEFRHMIYDLFSAIRRGLRKK